MTEPDPITEDPADEHSAHRRLPLGLVALCLLAAALYVAIKVIR